MSDTLHLTTPEGDEIVVGTFSEVRAAIDEIATLTGGSSIGGGISYLFGLRDAAYAEEVWQGPPASRIALEATYAQKALGEQLSGETNAFLQRLVALAE